MPAFDSFVFFFPPSVYFWDSSPHDKKKRKKKCKSECAFVLKIVNPGEAKLIGGHSFGKRTSLKSFKPPSVRFVNCEEVDDSLHMHSEG